TPPADLDRAQHGGTGHDLGAVADLGKAVGELAVEPAPGRTPQRHPVQQRDVRADLDALADHDAGRVGQAKPTADPGAGMDVRPGLLGCVHRFALSVAGITATPSPSVLTLGCRRAIYPRHREEDPSEAVHRVVPAAARAEALPPGAGLRDLRPGDPDGAGRSRG